MKKVQYPLGKPKLASAEIDKQTDLTGSDKFTKNKLTISTQGLQICILEYQHCHLKYIQEEYHHRSKCLDPDILDQKDQKEKCSSTTEIGNDSYKEYRGKGKRIK